MNPQVLTKRLFEYFAFIGRFIREMMLKGIRKRPETGVVGDNSGKWDQPTGRSPCDNVEIHEN